MGCILRRLKKKKNVIFSALYATAGEEECGSPVFTEGVIIHSLRLHVRVEVLLFFYCRGGQDTHFVVFFFSAKHGSSTSTHRYKHILEIHMYSSKASYTLCGFSAVPHQRQPLWEKRSHIFALGATTVRQGQRWPLPCFCDQRDKILTSSETTPTNQPTVDEMMLKTNSKQQLYNSQYQIYVVQRTLLWTQKIILNRTLCSWPHSKQLQRLFPFNSYTNGLLVLINLSSFNSSGSQKSVPKYVTNKYLADVTHKRPSELLNHLSLCKSWDYEVTQKSFFEDNGGCGVSIERPESLHVFPKCYTSALCINTLWREKKIIPVAFDRQKRGFHEKSWTGKGEIQRSWWNIQRFMSKSRCRQRSGMARGWLGGAAWEKGSWARRHFTGRHHCEAELGSNTSLHKGTEEGPGKVDRGEERGGDVE